MRTLLLLPLATLFAGFALVSCANDKEPERKAVPPPSAHDTKPWNNEGPSGGGATFGALPQNRYRR
jgi:hypothetical protein